MTESDDRVRMTDAHIYVALAQIGSRSPYHVSAHKTMDDAIEALSDETNVHPDDADVVYKDDGPPRREYYEHTRVRKPLIQQVYGLTKSYVGWGE